MVCCKKEEIKKNVNNIEKRIIKIRRDIHKIAELSGEEYKTKEYIQNILDKENISYETDFFKNAIIANIKGSSSKNIVAIRSDMDALPIEEKTNLSFASKNKGCMHACGHDAHMAIALGTAIILNKLKDKLSGCVKIIFQPAEEEAAIGGAKNIVKSGKLDDIKEIYGLHVSPGLPINTVGIKKGSFFAASDRFFVHIKGKASHAAQPNRGIDALMAASQFVVNVQNIVANKINPLDNAVCTIGVFHSGSRYNICSEDSYLEGTCRSYTEESRDIIKNNLFKILKGIDLSFNTKSELKYVKGHDSVYNNEECVDFVENVIKEYIGKKNCKILKTPTMCAEDFSSYLKKIKGTFMLLGTGYDGCYPLHNAKFTIDESILSTGVVLMTSICFKALNRLNKGNRYEKFIE